jgi:hypothetical protein
MIDNFVYSWKTWLENYWNATANNVFNSKNEKNPKKLQKVAFFKPHSFAFV